MKQQIKKWTLRITATGLFIVGILLVIVLYPTLTYANHTTHSQFTIYHDTAIDPSLLSKLDQVTALLKGSSWYDDNFEIDLCLNDSPVYPTIVNRLRGPAFAWGFYNKVVLQGNMDCKGNLLELHGYQWNLTQLLAHEMIHCYQYHRLGLLHSNPVANIPDWKWEGYAEYVARQSPEQQDFVKNMTRFGLADPAGWEITLEDGTIAPRTYYEAWMLVQYCLIIKQMTYEQLLEDTQSEIDLKNEMTAWYNRQSVKSEPLN